MGPRYGHMLLVRGYPLLVMPLVQSMESNVNLKIYAIFARISLHYKPGTLSRVSTALL